MDLFTVKQIGVARSDDKQNFWIELDPEYKKAMTGLEGFEYLNILWWFNRCDTPDCRAVLTEEQPYSKGPAVLGSFATRSPERPNPIALTCAQVTYLDMEKGIIGLAYFDALDQSPILDIKPYVPDWCAHWPKNVETSGDFDWSAEFNF